MKKGEWWDIRFTIHKFSYIPHAVENFPHRWADDESSWELFLEIHAGNERPPVIRN
jgi:hypothetical protein